MSGGGRMPFSDEELVLIEAIHTDPKNDAPRLAYADWLEADASTEHAEFIRLQCQQPYVVISNRDPQNPHQGYSFDFPYDDPTAKIRMARVIELFPAVYQSERYSAQRKLLYFEEHYRGLPLIHFGSEDESEIPDWFLKAIGYLSRVDLSLRVGRLTELLAHPIMRRVDKLHIWPDLPSDADRDPDFTMNSEYDDFWMDNIPILAASPIIDHLVELNPCGCHSSGRLTRMSWENLLLCKALLEGRVYVEYSY
jgi:uncharacterized protein (TIGR02996 family)